MRYLKVEVKESFNSLEPYLQSYKSGDKGYLIGFVPSRVGWGYVYFEKTEEIVDFPLSALKLLQED